MDELLLYLGFRSVDLKYRDVLEFSVLGYIGMVKERIRKIPVKYARSSVAKVEDRWSGIGMRSALSRNKRMLKRAHGNRG